MKQQKPTRQEANVQKAEDLAKRIAVAKLDLNTALLTGSPTAALRGALRALEAEQAAMEANAEQEQADKQAAEQALAQIQANRVADGAQQLAAARSARLDALIRPIPQRPIKDYRSSSHA